MADAKFDTSVVAIKTITLSDRDLRAVTRVLKLLINVEEGADRARELEKLAPTSTGIPYTDRAILTQRAGETYANRARRSRIFGKEMFGEAAWDMLLALYATEMSGTRHTVAGITDLAGVPTTTALRWLAYLKDKQLVTQRASPTDRRTFFIELTDRARDQLDAYFSADVP